MLTNIWLRNHLICRNSAVLWMDQHGKSKAVCVYMQPRNDAGIGSFSRNIEAVFKSIELTCNGHWSMVESNTDLFSKAYILYEY